MTTRITYQRPSWIAEGSEQDANLRFLCETWRGGPLWRDDATFRLRELSGWQWFKYSIGWNRHDADWRVRSAVRDFLFGDQPNQVSADERNLICRICFERLALMNERQFNRQHDLPNWVADVLKTRVRRDVEAAAEQGLPNTAPSNEWSDALAEIRLALRLNCANATELVGGNSLYNWFFKDLGTTGVYFMRDRRGVIRGVYKPVDEQLDNSPRTMQRAKYYFQTGQTAWLNAPQGSECLRHRGAPRAEAASWQLIRQMQMPDNATVIVPEVHMASLSSRDFYRYGIHREHTGPMTRMGSLSLFMENARPALSTDEPRIPHWAPYLDALTGGLDRKISSFLRQDERWVMFDFGASFPHRVPTLHNSRRNQFLWRSYPQAQRRWDEPIRTMHAQIYAGRDQLDLSLLDPQQRALLMRRWAVIDASIRNENGTPAQLAQALLQLPEVDLAGAGQGHGRDRPDGLQPGQVADAGAT
jgi:hypothetical protein